MPHQQHQHYLPFSGSKGRIGINVGHDIVVQVHAGLFALQQRGMAQEDARQERAALFEQLEGSVGDYRLAPVAQQDDASHVFRLRIADIEVEADGRMILIEGKAVPFPFFQQFFPFRPGIGLVPANRRHILVPGAEDILAVHQVGTDFQRDARVNRPSGGEVHPHVHQRVVDFIERLYQQRSHGSAPLNGIRSNGKVVQKCNQLFGGCRRKGKGRGGHCEKVLQPLPFLLLHLHQPGQPLFPVQGFPPPHGAFGNPDRARKVAVGDCGIFAEDEKHQKPGIVPRPFVLAQQTPQ